MKLDISEEKRDLYFDTRIRIFKNEKAFGPGMARILENIDTTGSIKQACQLMDMSYSKGWKIINNAETCLGFKLLERKKGGADNGGCILTLEGRKLLDNYNDFVKESEEYMEQLFGRYFNDYK